METEELVSFWTDSLPHVDLERLCRSALAGQDLSDRYLTTVAELAWAGALAAVGDRFTTPPQFVLTADNHLESAALSAASDGSIDLSATYLRKSALESLQLAEEMTLEYSAQFAFGAPPSWVIGTNDYVERIIMTGDRDRSGLDSYNYVLDDIDHMSLLYSSILRGEPAPPVGSPRQGLRESGILHVRSREGDYGLINDPDWGDHILRLHHHLLVNTLIFGLVHECAHLFLGHFGRPAADAAAARAHEVAADQAALDALGFSMLADIPSALSIFRHLHESERRVTDRHSLTHPYSAERLRLLAIAVRDASLDPFLLGRVKEILRSLKEDAGNITFFDTGTGEPLMAHVLACADWDAAYLTATVRDTGELRHDTLVGLDVSFIRPVEQNVVATARVLQLVPPRSGGSVSDGTGTNYRVEARLPTPPAWRLAWPDGMLRIDRLIRKEDLPDEGGESPVMRVLKTGRVTVWDMPDESLLALREIRAGLQVHGALWGDLAGLAQWLDEYGYTNESIALRSALIEVCPELATFGVVLRTVRQLNDRGEYERARKLGYRYIEEGGMRRPGLHLELAKAADALGEGLAVFDETFIEQLTFGETGPYIKEAKNLQLDNFTRRREDPALKALRVIQGTGTLCEVYPVRRYGAIKRWPVRERIEFPHLIRRTGHHVHHTTGFDREEIIDLCIRINSVQPGTGSPNWPPYLGLFKSVVATLTYMRHNRTQAEIGESLGVSQPTISRAISAITPLVPEVTREFVPTADDLDPDAQYILDGTLLPCWSWDGHKELYSGKHKTTGMNVQVACTIYGKLAWISDPVNGSRHDNYCREESGVLLTMNPGNWIGDKGYIGNNMITPFRKPAGGELLDWQKEYNSEVNKIRWMIEQVISHFKNWTIMHTDYRRPLKTFETTISAVVGLHFYRTA